MFGISGIELFMILAVALLIFGPDEMPRIGRTIGKGLRMFNDARSEVQNVITTEMMGSEDADLFKDPLGLKGMQQELGDTVKNLADPNFKPVPKGAGVRVASDDARDERIAQAQQQAAQATAQAVPAAAQPQPSIEMPRTQAGSIWGSLDTPEVGEDAR